jgi:hypothetical protein
VAEFGFKRCCGRDHVYFIWKNIPVCQISPIKKGAANERCALFKFVRTRLLGLLQQGLQRLALL